MNALSVVDAEELADKILVELNTAISSHRNYQHVIISDGWGGGIALAYWPGYRVLVGKSWFNSDKGCRSFSIFSRGFRDHKKLRKYLVKVIERKQTAGIQKGEQ